MPYLNDEQRALLKDYLLGDMSTSEFAAALAVGVDELPSVGARILAAAVRERDALDLQLGMGIGFHTRLTDEYVAPLLGAVDGEWHGSHEDVVSALDDLRRPEAIDAFVRAALTTYAVRAYDTYGALASKAMWALGNLATRESVAALAKLAVESDLSDSRNDAVEHLERVAGKAKDETVRAAARTAIEQVRRPPG
jgi:hypothetical protein